MSENRRTLRWTVGIIAVGAVAIGSLSTPSAQDTAPADPPVVDEPIPPRPQRTRSPFSAYPADPGALTYESLSDTPIPDIDIDPEGPIDPAIYAIVANETKASVDDAQAWAETHNGHAVSQRWSGYSAVMRARAKVKAAEYASGTTGLGDVGVE